MEKEYQCQWCALQVHKESDIEHCSYCDCDHKGGESPHTNYRSHLRFSITKEKTCPGCKKKFKKFKFYNVETDPPQKAEACPNDAECGAPLDFVNDDDLFNPKKEKFN